MSSWKEKWMKNIKKILANKKIYEWDCWKEEDTTHYEKIKKINLDHLPNYDTKYNELLGYYNKELFYKYATLPWSTYLIDKFGIDNINIFLNKLLKYIQNNK
jgi:hypothetical protein